MISQAPRNLWNVKWLIVANAAALLLIGSWVFEPTRAYWDLLDQAVFFFLNGSLADGTAWQTYWAAANTRQFDAVMALFILVLYAWFVLAGNREQAVDRISIGVIMTVLTMVAILFSKQFLDIDRMGPSTSLTPAILLSDFVDAFEFKDASNSSFTSDHAIGLFITTFLMWRYGGRKLGIPMLILTVYWLLPRMVVGAHWLTDSLVGSLFLCTLLLSWLLATPLHDWLFRRIRPGVASLVAWIERLLTPVGGSGDFLSDFRHSLGHAARGFCMGCADIIPGVSGGTMALILGIYERLLKAIRSFDIRWLKSVVQFRWREALLRNDALFLLPLVIGILSAIGFFTRIIPLPYFVEERPDIIYGLFFGLILASVIILMRQVERYRAIDIVIAALGVLLGFFIVTLVPVETPTALWFIYMCGFIAISAMLLPGISGSFILLILGKYAYILAALGNVDLAVILTFIAGAFTGLVVFSRAIVWLLDRFNRQTLLIIKGILIGSLWVIWPFQEQVFHGAGDEQRLIGSTPVWPAQWSFSVGLSLALMVAGFLAVLYLDRLYRSASSEKNDRTVSSRKG